MGGGLGGGNKAYLVQGVAQRVQGAPSSAKLSHKQLMKVRSLGQWMASTSPSLSLPECSRLRGWCGRSSLCWSLAFGLCRVPVNARVQVSQVNHLMRVQVSGGRRSPGHDLVLLLHVLGG